jgi:hypothetical protein
VRQPGLKKRSDLGLHIVLDPADGEIFSINEQIGGAWVSVIGEADAASVGDPPSVEGSYE